MSEPAMRDVPLDLLFVKKEGLGADVTDCLGHSNHRLLSF